MAKNKSNELPRYELLYLISNQYSEDELPPIKDKIKELISKNGGELTHEESMGKKRLAYQIKGFRHGYYELVEFEVEGENLGKIDKGIRLMNEILRHQTIRTKAMTEDERRKKEEEKTARLEADSRAREEEAEEEAQPKSPSVDTAKSKTKEEEPKPAEPKTEEKSEQTTEEKTKPKADQTGEEAEEDKGEDKDTKEKKSKSMDDLDEKLDKILEDDNLV